MTHRDAQNEVRQNYEAFKALLPELMAKMPGKFVVLHQKELAKSFDSFGDAVRFGYKAYGRGHFSVQEVTDRAISLGAQSYALHSASN